MFEAWMIDIKSWNIARCFALKEVPIGYLGAAEQRRVLEELRLHKAGIPAWLLVDFIEFCSERSNVLFLFLLINFYFWEFQLTHFGQREPTQKPI